MPQGRVYGVDLEPDMVRYMGERAQREGLSNLTPVLATAEDARLPEPVDLALIVDTYHHVGERVAWLQRLAEKLRPGGRVAIVDFRVESSMGPPPAHKLSPERVREEFEAAGYRRPRRSPSCPSSIFWCSNTRRPERFARVARRATARVFLVALGSTNRRVAGAWALALQRSTRARRVLVWTVQFLTGHPYRRTPP
ncbi:class I SAM-dependent methyltransferase [Cystobacter fuscus]